LEARIGTEWGKRVDRMAGYENDEDTLRRELGSIRSWMSWRPLAASLKQQEDMVGRSGGENIGPIREN